MSQVTPDPMEAAIAEGPILRVRLHFAKRGDARFLGHHDLVRCLERMIRRAALPVARSRGFNPRPRMVFAHALALGIAGLREVVEIDFAQHLPASEVLERLRAVTPDGLEWLDAFALDSREHARVVAARYRITIPPDRRSRANAALEAFLATESFPIVRTRAGVNRQPARVTQLDLRSFVEWAVLDEKPGRLRFQLRIAADGSAKPEEFLNALGLSDLTLSGAFLEREDLVLADANQVGGPRDPLSQPTQSNHRVAPSDSFPEYSLAAES